MNAVVMLALVLFMCIGPGTVQGLPSGAPSSACSSLTPNPDSHLAEPMDEDSLPYVLNISSLYLGDGDYGYEPGEDYSCKLYNHHSSLALWIMVNKYSTEIVHPYGEMANRVLSRNFNLGEKC